MIICLAVFEPESNLNPNLLKILVFLLSFLLLDIMLFVSCVRGRSYNGRICYKLYINVRQDMVVAVESVSSSRECQVVMTIMSYMHRSVKVMGFFFIVRN